jgi:ubiquinone/menaquinone biosynthesis C-methylase UbiE
MNMKLNSIWDGRPEEYSALRKCWLNERRSIYIQEFLKTLERPGAKVLEIGSGTGELLLDLAKSRPELRFMGVEPQGSYIEFSRKAAQSQNISNANFIEGSAENVKELIGQGQVDLVLSNDMLHHVGSVDSVTQSVRAVCKANAKWLCIEPNVMNPYVWMGQAFRQGERNFFPGHFVKQASRSGWKLKNREYLFLIPPFMKSPSDWLKIVEKRLEGVAFVAGGVALSLESVGLN